MPTRLTPRSIIKTRFLFFLLLSLCGTADFALCQGAIAKAVSVFDECNKISRYTKVYCRSIIMSSNFDDCYSKCSINFECFNNCALKDSRAYPPNEEAKAAIASQDKAKEKEKIQLADDFVGLTEKELVKQMGNPQKAADSDSPDGPFRMLTFDETDGSETFFIIFKKDGVVSGGYFKGKMFEDPGYNAMIKNCNAKWPSNLDKQLACQDTYRTPKRKK